jgi:hypothetical protein
VPSRKLTYDPSAGGPGGKATFHIEQLGPIGEAEIESELLPLLYKYHPALEDASGRLKQQPGVRELMSIGPEFFLTPPDDRGVSHFGGLRLPYAVKEAFVSELRASGWIVEE